MRENREQRESLQEHSLHGECGIEFLGFDPPSSNTTPIPNQFFDVALKHTSPAAFRLLSTMMIQSLRWIDDRGNPFDGQPSFTYTNLIKLGCARSNLRKALNELLRNKFILCTTDSNHPPQISYEIRYHTYENNRYIKDLSKFHGFFYTKDIPNANRTDIPNQLFDLVFRKERRLAVSQILGLVARHSIGFQDPDDPRPGKRKQQASLAYNDFKNLSGIKQPRTVADGLKICLDLRYITRHYTGTFDLHNGGIDATKSVYSLNWNELEAKPDGLKNALGKSQKCTRACNPKNALGRVLPMQSDQSRKCSDIETKPLNETSKTTTKSDPNDSEAVVRGEIDREAQELLRKEGFNATTAEKLAKEGLAVIRQQIEWIDARKPKSRKALLHKAIRENWEAPVNLPRSRGATELESSAARTLVLAFMKAQPNLVVGNLTQPCRSDLRQAQQFLSELHAISSDVDPVEWGTEFARFCQSQASPRNQFCPAIQIYADQFLNDTRKQLKRRDVARVRAANQKEDLARQLHQETHFNTYLDFLRERESAVRSKLRDEYLVFQSDREKFRTQLENDAKNPALRGISRMMLKSFDQDESRLVAFAKYFAESDSIPDFWTWDREVNSKSFSVGLLV